MNTATAWFCDLGHKGADELEQWHHYKVYKTRLRSCYVSRFAVTEHTYGHFLVFFDVALDEELLKEQVGPLVNEVKRPARLRNISRVNDDVHNGLLAGKGLQVILLIPSLG